MLQDSVRQPVCGLGLKPAPGGPEAAGRPNKHNFRNENIQFGVQIGINQLTFSKMIILISDSLYIAISCLVCLCEVLCCDVLCFVLLSCDVFCYLVLSWLAV